MQKSKQKISEEAAERIGGQEASVEAEKEAKEKAENEAALQAENEDSEKESMEKAEKDLAEMEAKEKTATKGKKANPAALSNAKNELDMMNRLKVDTLFKNSKKEYFTQETFAVLSEGGDHKRITKIQKSTLEATINQ
jgi:hypothetical protein